MASFWEGPNPQAPTDPNQKNPQPPGQTPGIVPPVDQMAVGRAPNPSRTMAGGAELNTLPVEPTPASSQPAPAQQPPPAQPSQPQAPDQAGITQFQNWAQQTFGRQATPQELQQIAVQIGYTGGPITPELMQRAQDAARQYAQSRGWQPPAAPTPAPGPQQPQTPTTPHTPGPGVAPPTPPPAQAQTPVDQALQQRILQMLGTNTGDVNTGSQEYQSQLGAFRRGQQRSIEQAKNAAAERAAGSGTLNTGGFDAAQTGIDLAAAQGEGDFTAQLAGQQLSRQREDLQQALQLAQQSGLANEARQLQERLASVDANLRQQGLNLQGELGRSGINLQQQGLDLQRLLGTGDLDLRRLLGQGQLELGRGDLDLRRLLGLGQLDLGRQQIGLGRDRLGLDYAQLAQQGDQALLQAILQGL